MGRLFADGTYADCTLLIGIASVSEPLHTLRASRLVLSGGSAFFERLFAPGFRESAATAPVLIKVDDAEEATHLCALVRFFYTGELPASALATPATEASLTQLLHFWCVADRFVAPRATAAVADAICSSPTSATPAQVLALPLVQTHPGLRELAALVARALFATMPTLAFGVDATRLRYAPLDALIDALTNRDGSHWTTVTSENDILTAVVAWLDARAPDESLPEDARFRLFSCVRFPGLTRSVLAHIVPVLLAEERGPAPLTAEQRAALTRRVMLAWSWIALRPLTNDPRFLAHWAADVAIDDTNVPRDFFSHGTRDPRRPCRLDATLRLDAATVPTADSPIVLRHAPLYWNGVCVEVQLEADVNKGGALSVRCEVLEICGRSVRPSSSPAPFPGLFLPMNIGFACPTLGVETTMVQFVHHNVLSRATASAALLNGHTLATLRARSTPELRVTVVLSAPAMEWHVAATRAFKVGLRRAAPDFLLPDQ